ncbi:hypothetical protein WJX81_004400 [Elliptochloris bilobata]|uniref:Class I SAM-dependent methyltransferase n=1 Tax=Elliptochloris bilobata TaxID=381761 RepID=A0AAW1SD82_9CHLO
MDEHIHSPDNVENRFDHNIAAVGAALKVVKLKGPSLQTLARLVADASVLYDVVYVDGSHAARDVMGDAVLAWALLRPGGVLILDDYRYDHILDLPPEEYPKSAIDAFIKLFAKELFVLEVGYQCIVEKCM